MLDGLVDPNVAAAIGEQIIALADRIAQIDKITPGVMARQGMTVDGKQFDIFVRVRPE